MLGSDEASNIQISFEKKINFIMLIKIQSSVLKLFLTKNNEKDKENFKVKYKLKLNNFFNTTFTSRGQHVQILCALQD